MLIMDIELEVLLQWSPKNRTVHCSNCSNCKVTTDPLGVIVYCAKGWGEPRAISTVIRANNPRGWNNAKLCPDFDSMED